MTSPKKPKNEIKTAQIGQCGVLLLQYELLRNGIESAPMTTDSGVDLVAYSPKSGEAVTIQVKATEKAKPAGGKGKDAIDWWIVDDSPAQFAAFVYLEKQEIWILSKAEVATCAQQHSSGRHHFYMYVDENIKKLISRPTKQSDFARFLLKNRISEIFKV